MSIASDWHAELSADPRRGPHDPLFPATEMALSDENSFTAKGLANREWSTSGPIREIFREVFNSAGLPYFNPHSIRDMLVRHIVSLNLPVETMKCWSQNLGHDGLLTTLTSYGSVPTDRQGELIKRGLEKRSPTSMLVPDPTFVAAVIQVMQERSA